MAQALVTITAEGILKKVLGLVTAEIVVAWGYEEKLARLHETLDLIRAKLHDAEGRKGTEAVMVWLKQLQQVVGKADDVLDEIHYEMLRREVMARKVSSLPYLKKFSFRRKMGHKIENITKKLVEINKQANDLGLQNEQHDDIVADNLIRDTDPYLDEEFKIFGRENDELRIIQLLTQSRKEETLTIIPLVGMGGIGKTTLAKSIYNNEIIEQHFDVRVWLCVSVKVDVNTLLAKIYESLVGEECKSQMRVNLIRNLRNKLGYKRYLLVLDDVWDEEKTHWDDFKSCMLKVPSESGSGILITTRNLEIGTKAMSENFHVLQGLPDDSCWSLFKERAFFAGRLSLPELEVIGYEIVKKCRGLPLLVNVIGCMLRNYNDKDKWLSIKDSNVWDLEDDGERVQNSLKLSFDNLPSSISKQCFAYCSIFEKDNVMKKEKMILLWMALGLVQADERRNKDAEDVGNDIFQILASSSLFQDVKMDEYGYVTCCMHDLVHDLSFSVSKHECFSIVDPTRDDIARVCHVKHIAVYQPREMYAYLFGETVISFEEMISVLFKEDMTARNLRTLIFQGHIEKKFLFSNEYISFNTFTNLRILKFKGYGLKKIADSIGELVHLRYLDFSRTKINVLPKSICKLYHLQTLKLHHCLLKKLPDMNDLISLRHLMLRGNMIHKGGITIRNVGQLTSLRTFSFFRVGREKSCHIAEIGHLKHLTGELRITNLEKISNKEDVAKADLSSKKKLNRIELCWSENKGPNRNDKGVLEGLHPPENVKILVIENFSGDNFPSWVTKMAIDIEGKWTPLHKLVKIRLSGCRSCLYLPVLEYLPLLQDLALDNMDNLTFLSTSLGEDVNITRLMKPLSPSLRSLRLSDMRRLEKWTDASTNNSIMLSPVLESLYIENCPMITLLDECHPHPLVSLEIRSCINLMLIMSIQGLKALESLHIENCFCLLAIPDLSPVLKSLNILFCKDIIHLDEIHPRPLVSLRIADCENLMSIKSIQGLTSLESLSIVHCHSLLEIGSLHNYERHPLKKLRIKFCHKLTSLPKLDCFSFLNKLKLGYFSKELRSFPSLQGIENSRNHLRFLELYGWDHWESIPEEVQHLTSLIRLQIYYFGIRELPMWLSNMSSIRDVLFFRCKWLDKETVKRGAPREAKYISLDGEYV